MEINLCAQEFDLGVLAGFVHINVPESVACRRSHGSISIAALIQRAFQLNRRLFGPDANSLATGPLKQDREGGSV